MTKKPVISRLELLRHELLSMRTRDQQARDSLTVKSAMNQLIPPEAIAWCERIDGENTARMKEIIDLYGWPGRSLVGEDGAADAFLLVQHADRDRAFQTLCLGLLRLAVDAGEAPARHLAFLTDRLSVARNGTQLYGTQMILEEGSYRFAPIREPEGVNARRAEVGLPPLSDYLSG